MGLDVYWIVETNEMKQTYVDPLNGCDETGDGSPEHPFKTIDGATQGESE